VLEHERQAVLRLRVALLRRQLGERPGFDVGALDGGAARLVQRRQRVLGAETRRPRGRTIKAAQKNTKAHRRAPPQTTLPTISMAKERLQRNHECKLHNEDDAIIAADSSALTKQERLATHS
jgi:hypothetical protein